MLHCESFSLERRLASYAAKHLTIEIVLFLMCGLILRFLPEYLMLISQILLKNSRYSLVTPFT